MKILIGYDGSDCAEAALQDLRRAGLPNDCEALVMNVADVFQPPPIKEVDYIFPMYVPAGVKWAHEHAAKAVAQAREGQLLLAASTCPQTHSAPHAFSVSCFGPR